MKTKIESTENKIKIILEPENTLEIAIISSMNLYDSRTEVYKTSEDNFLTLIINTKN